MNGMLILTTALHLTSAAPNPTTSLPPDTAEIELRSESSPASQSSIDVTESNAKERIHEMHHARAQRDADLQKTHPRHRGIKPSALVQPEPILHLIPKPPAPRIEIVMRL